jgi:hypothetical protein
LFRLPLWRHCRFLPMPCCGLPSGAASRYHLLQRATTRAGQNESATQNARRQLRAKRMNRARYGAFLLTAAALALGGCEEATTGRAATDTASAPVAGTAQETTLVERDVEAPQVFEATDSGLWDGRPSLGGVWVASPDAVDPERVIIRNPANGKFVIGALFRRERLNPGPALQISSDAAAALGILAGAPAQLHVTALRREEVTDTPAPDATEPLLDTAETVAEEEPELVASAAAAIDRAAGNPTVTDVGPASEPAAAATAATPSAEEPAAEEAVAGARADNATETAAAGEAPKKRRGWLFGRKPAAEAETAAAADDGEITATTLDGTPVETAPLSAIPAITVAAPAPAPAPAPAAPAKPRSSGAGVVQIGFFSVEANADRTVTMLNAQGVPARKLTDSAKGKTFWRVVADAPDRTAMLSRVKAAGFTDAYLSR